MLAGGKYTLIRLCKKLAQRMSKTHDSSFCGQVRDREWAVGSVVVRSCGAAHGLGEWERVSLMKGFGDEVSALVSKGSSSDSRCSSWTGPADGLSPLRCAGIVDLPSLPPSVRYVSLRFSLCISL